MRETDTNPRVLLTNVFADVRRYITGLGLRDLLDALRLVEDDSEHRESLREDVRLLWCRSWSEEKEFDRIWDLRQTQAADSLTAEDLSMSPPADRGLDPERARPLAKEPPATDARTARSDAGIASAYPVKPPSRLPLRTGPAELTSHTPISRRGMEYGWQYLTRPRSDGPATLLDIKATVIRAAKQGYFLEPVLQSEMRDHAHLVLLVDRNGSMAPFHRLARDLVETAGRAHSEERIGRLDVCYFHNVVTDHFYSDSKLAKLVTLNGRAATAEQALSHCGRDTRILVISDAGAARGTRRMDRIAATDEMLFRISRLTRFIAWLNPMPESRWASTSARIIAQMVPMFELTTAGFRDAISTLRDRTPWRTR